MAYSRIEAGGGELCESMNMNAGAGAEVNDTVKVTKTNPTQLDKVMTAEFTISNQDGVF